MLFIYYDQPQLLKRGENRRPRSDYHFDASCGDFAPFIITLPVGQPAVHHRHISAESALEAFYHLGGQGNFRNQHNGFFPFIQTGLDGLHINLGFAAAGYTVQQEHSVACRFYRVADTGIYLCLLHSKRQR
ncbi:hypothetical protein D3C75_895640 [compost metagenome]